MEVDVGIGGRAGLGRLLLAALLALAGCSAGGGTQPQATEPALVERPFQQRQAPPEGRAAQLTVAEASPHECSGRPTRPGSPASIQAELPAELTICFAELAPDTALLLEIARPDGQVEHGAAWADARGEARLLRLVMPDDPVGAYEITGIQSEQTIRVTINVARPSAPRLAVLPQAGEPGVTFSAQLAGFTAHESIDLDLYRVDGSGASYLAPLGAVQADGDGKAAYILPSYPDDPPGSYWLSATPRGGQESAGARFFIVAEPTLAGAEQLPAAGQSAVTLGPLDLYEAAGAGAARVEARPLLHRGTLVTLLNVEPEAIKVRTLDDGVEGWLRAGPERLALGRTILGEQAPFAPGTRVVVTEGPLGIPLRAEPSSGAAKVRDLVATGQQATLLELRGDWLRVALDDGAEGWLRWHYDGARYVGAAVNG